MITLKVCHGHACACNFSKYTFERAKNDLDLESDEGGTTPDGKITLTKCPCQGNCAKGPTVIVEQDGRKEVHSKTDPTAMATIIKKPNTKKH